MSSYSDWKCGAITDEQYDLACEREAREDEAFEEERSEEE